MRRIHTEQVYQLIIARLNGDLIGDPSYEERIRALVLRGIGGFILFGGIREPVTRFVKNLQTLSRVPLFIASDVERGVGQQIKGATRFPSQMAIAAAIRREMAEDVDLLRQALRWWAAEARDVGINLLFSPVLDVNSNPDNPIICTRAFSDVPETVAWFGGRYVDAFRAEGLLCCGKHFPGHGDTEIDSHISLPRIDRTREELARVDLPPFAEAIRLGVPCIMVGHLLLPTLDSAPATLSYNVVQGLLRTDMGFRGLITTDALNMNSLNAYKDIAVLSLKAGVDLLLHPPDPDLAVAEICNAIDNGALKAEVIEQAIGRIMKAKQKMAAPVQNVVQDYAAHRDMAKNLFRRSLTVLKQPPRSRKGSLAQDRILAVVGERFDISQSPLRTLRLAGADVAGRDVLIALFPTVSAWKGSSGLSEGDISLVRSIIRKARSSVIVSFGSPYVLPHFTDADTLIAMYDDADGSQEALLLWMSGALTASGRCPVKVGL